MRSKMPLQCRNGSIEGFFGRCIGVLHLDVVHVRELVQAVKHRKVRLHGEEGILIGILVIRRKDFKHLAFALSGRDDARVVKRVLDVNVFDIRCQIFIALHRILLAEREVAHIKHALHAAVKVFHQIKAILGGFAVDGLFVFVAECEAALFGKLEKNL